MHRRHRMVWRAIVVVGVIAVALLPLAVGFVWPRRDRLVGIVVDYLRPERTPTSTLQVSVLPVASAMPPEASATSAPSPTVTPSPSAILAMPQAPALKATSLLEWVRERILLPLIRSEQPTPTPTPTVTSTPRPKPTKTPTLPWPAPLEAPSHSKIGLHVQWNNSSEIMEFVRRMKPPVVKAVGDFGMFPEIKEESPTTVTIGRMNVPQPIEGDPANAARAFVAEHLETYQLNPAVDYWEGWNEPGLGGRMDWYAAFEAERVRAMAAHGFRCAIGSFSAGVPEWEEMAAFLPAIMAAKEHGGIFSLHEYDAPILSRSIGAGLPGHPNYPDRGALALRYRWWYEDYLKPRQLVIPLAVTEVGIDGGIGGRPGPEGGGWRDFAGYWRDEGLGNDPIRVYLEQLALYDAEMQKDSYVIGCAIFTVGAMNQDWKSFDITDYLRHLATFVILPQAK